MIKISDKGYLGYEEQVLRGKKSIKSFSRSFSFCLLYIFKEYSDFFQKKMHFLIIVCCVYRGWENSKKLLDLFRVKVSKIR